MTLRVWNLYSTTLAFLLCQVKLLEYPWVVQHAMNIVNILLSRIDSKTGVEKYFLTGNSTFLGIGCRLFW